MTLQITKVGNLLAGIAVIGVLAFGTSTALSARIPCNAPAQLGECPPFTESSCTEACWEEFQTWGTCDGEQCCTCVL